MRQWHYGNKVHVEIFIDVTRYYHYMEFAYKLQHILWGNYIYIFAIIQSKKYNHIHKIKAKTLCTHSCVCKVFKIESSVTDNFFNFTFSLHECKIKRAFKKNLLFLRRNYHGFQTWNWKILAFSCYVGVKGHHMWQIEGIGKWHNEADIQ